MSLLGLLVLIGLEQSRQIGFLMVSTFPYAEKKSDTWCLKEVFLIRIYSLKFQRLSFHPTTDTYWYARLQTSKSHLLWALLLTIGKMIFFLRE